MTQRVLDWRPRYDERSRGYGVAAALPTPPVGLPRRGRLWRHGAVLDQGAEGACVGFGCADTVAADPVPLPGVDDAYALGWYRRAQTLDDWPGEGYSGTSVLAGCLVGRERGLWSGFRWAFSVTELAHAIVTMGPAVIGVQWRDGMYETDARGVVQATGSVVGGHCLSVVGFHPHHKETGGPAFTWLNSWGDDYGTHGLGIVPLDVMAELMAAGGEFAVPTDRALPTGTQPATAVAGGEPDDEDDDGEPAGSAPGGGPSPATSTVYLPAVDVVERDQVTAPGRKGRVTVHAVRHHLAGTETVVRLDTTGGELQISSGQVLRVRRPI